jgi:hypothetical protein
MAENNRRALDQGFTLQDLKVFMRCNDYRHVATVNEDMIFQHRSAA